MIACLYMETFPFYDSYRSESFYNMFLATLGVSYGLILGIMLRNHSWRWLGEPYKMLRLAIYKASTLFVIIVHFWIMEKHFSHNIKFVNVNEIKSDWFHLTVNLTRKRTSYIFILALPLPICEILVKPSKPPILPL